MPSRSFEFLGASLAMLLHQAKREWWGEKTEEEWKEFVAEKEEEELRFFLPYLEAAAAG